MEKGIKFDKRESMVRDCKIARFGKYKPKEIIDNMVIDTEPLTSIDEFTFYKVYLELNNIIRWKKVDNRIVDMKISAVPLELMAYMMTLDLDFTLIYRNKDSKLIDIANKLNKTHTSIYNSMTKLRKSEYLVTTEDGFCTPNQECKDLMIKTKKAIKDKGHLAFDFLFKFCVK